MRRWGLALLGCAAGAASAAPLALPRLDGEFSGDLALLKSPATPLHWTLRLATAAGEQRTAAFEANGPGIALRAEAQLDAAGAGTWHLVEARLDLGRWLGILASVGGADLASVSLTGEITASGNGSWTSAAPGGQLQLQLRQGQLDDPALKLHLDGVECAIAIQDLAARKTAPTQVLTWQGGHYDIVTLGPGRVVFALAGDEVRVDEAKLSAFDGELSLGGFRFSMQQAEFGGTARVAGLDLAQLLPLLPPGVVQEAHGRVDGEITLRRDASGIHLGTGRLALRAGAPADVRLAPTPGLLSSSLPEAVKKYYPGLTGIEQGRVPIRADALEINLMPDGDADGRTATIHLAGGPVDPNLRAPLDLVVNVHGPLESLVRFGTDSRLRFGGGH